MPRLLTRHCQQKPKLPQPLKPRLGMRFSRLPQPLPPTCESAGTAQSEAKGYWRRQALREALLAAVVTSVLTSAVQAAPQLFTQPPAQSLRELATLLLPQGAGFQASQLLECP